MKKIFSNIIGNIVYFFKYEYKFVLGAFLALLEFMLLYIIFSNIIAFNFSGTLIIFLAIVPWIVFGVFANIKNDKYQKFWFNEKNVQVILNAINSPASASYVVAEYERFISFEKMNYSFMAKYFISDKCKTDKFQYEFAAKEYSLYRFCRLYTLVCHCESYALDSYSCSPSEVINSARYICHNISDYITEYYYKNKASTVSPYYMEEVLATYISFSLSNKLKMSFERYILFAAEYYKAEAYNYYRSSDERSTELLNFYNGYYNKNINLTKSEYDLNTYLYYFHNRLPLFINDLENITSQFQYPKAIKVFYRKEYNYAIIKHDYAVISVIDVNISNNSFNSIIDQYIADYLFKENLPFSKQFIIADSDSDFRQHNLSMIYNGDNSVKLKTSLSEYSPNQPLTVFINNLEIGSIPNTDLKYFQKPNYNQQISKINISVSTNTDNIKTYKATVTVNFTVIKKTVIKKPAVRVNQKAVSLVECPKCKTLNSFSSTNCTLCNTPLFIEDINKTEQNEQN